MNFPDNQPAKIYPYEWLVVDLDGSLIKTDSLVESVIGLAKRNIILLLRCLLSLRHGRAAFKAAIADRFLVTPENLPYQKAVLNLIAECKRQGIKVCLATAADTRIAKAVADHLKMFDLVLGSDATRNLKSKSKLREIVTHIGSAKFAYLGNHKADIEIWKASEYCYVASNAGRLNKCLRNMDLNNITSIGDDSKASIFQWLKLLRIKQWAKNLLIFVPLILSHEILDPDKFTASALAFVFLGLAASGGYIVNDMLDLEADRNHPSKRSRPLASGTISLTHALAVSVILFALSIAGSAYLISLTAAVFVAAYIFASLGYTLYLKTKLLLDVLMLCTLFTYRIIFGGAVSNIEISQWLLLFSMFMFLSLSFLKRYIDLKQLGDGDLEALISGRGYRSGDLSLVRSMGVTAGFIASLIMSFYITSEDVAKLYKHPDLLWLALLIIFYWQARLWFLADRGEMPHDPVSFALRDRISLLCGLSCGLLLVTAMIDL